MQNDFANLKWYQLDFNDAFSGVNNKRLVRHTPTTCQKSLKIFILVPTIIFSTDHLKKAKDFEYFKFH